MSKVFAVFGSSGFIGSSLVQKLLSEGFEVYAFSRKCNNYNNPNFHWQRFDISTFNTIKIPKKSIVIDCISETTPKSSTVKSSKTISDELLHHTKLIDRILCQEPEKYVFLSTAGGMYGECINGTAHSEDTLPRPSSPHAIVKLALENYLRYFAELKKIDYVICRISNPYGYSQQSKKDFALIPTLINNLLENKNPILYGSGKLERDYIHIIDVVKYLIAVATSTTNFNLYNLSSGKSITNMEIYQEITRYFGIRKNPNLVENREFDLKKVVIDSTRLQNEFGKLSKQAIDLSFVRALKKQIK